MFPKDAIKDLLAFDVKHQSVANEAFEGPKPVRNGDISVEDQVPEQRVEHGTVRVPQLERSELIAHLRGAHQASVGGQQVVVRLHEDGREPLSGAVGNAVTVGVRRHVASLNSTRTEIEDQTVFDVRRFAAMDLEVAIAGTPRKPVPKLVAKPRKGSLFDDPFVIEVLEVVRAVTSCDNEGGQNHDGAQPTLHNHSLSTSTSTGHAIPSRLQAPVVLDRHLVNAL